MYQDFFKQAFRSKLSDKQLPSDNDHALWEKIEREIKPVAKKTNIKWYAAAASIILMITAGITGYYYNHSTETHFPLYKSSPIASGNKIINYLLPDHSSIALNAGSTIRVDSFYNQRRNIELKGEAYVEVKPNSKMPFNIYFSNYRLEVVGTKFNVRDLEKEIFKEITVTEGIVRIYQDTSSRFIELKAGDQLVLTHGKEPKIRKVQSHNYISWLTGKIDFKKCTLEEVVHVLSRNYNTEIVLPNHIHSCKFSGDLSGLNLEEALNVLCLSNSFELNKENNKYIIQGSGCE